MNELNVKIEWCDKNYCASCNDESLNGIVVATSKTLNGIKAEIANAIVFHIEGCISDGDTLPDWITNHNYELVFDYQFSVIMRMTMEYIPLSVLSRETGINQKQLNHYANGIKTPRKPMRERIMTAVHNIGSQLQVL